MTKFNCSYSMVYFIVDIAFSVKHCSVILMQISYLSQDFEVKALKITSLCLFLVFLFHHSQDSGNGYSFTGFIIYLYQPFYNTFCNILFRAFFLLYFFFYGEFYAYSSTGIYRFGKTAFVNAIIQQNRALFRIYK